ncbi:MAG: ABC transporter substrate-binding protein [Alphaproteobacteria bacterium]|nr:ABC transporter substrate-binding protein [Alphaproteobacteria bacterium]
MNMRSGRIAAAAAALAVVAFAAAPADAQKRGGTLIFAQEAPPPTLDPYFSTSVSTRNVAMNMFETLLTRNENNGLIKELAEDYSVSADGLTYTFALRKGVRFHNGKEMTSADVKASYERYKRMALPKVTLAPVRSFEAPDPYTFVMVLDKPVPVFLEEISAFVSPIAILPAEQKDREGGKIDLIGTGPLQFVEWVADSHLKLKRFDGYKPDARYKGTDGFAGRKDVLVDMVEIRLVKEGGARVAGLESGQLHIVEDIPTESAKRLVGRKDIVLYDLKNWWLHGTWVNHARAPTDNPKIRRAMQIALDMEAIMDISSDGAYTLQPGLQYPGNPYYVDTGKEYYNVNDPKKAAALLKEAGYKGEEFVIITNSSYQSMYKAAQVVAEQLKAVGFKVRIDVFDWATALARRPNKDAWNIWFTGQGTGPSVGPFTALKDVVTPQLNQFVPDPVIDALFAEMISGTTLEARKASFAKFQARVYENVLFLKFGDFERKQATRANIKGYAPYRIPRFWNVSIEN